MHLSDGDRFRCLNYRSQKRMDRVSAEMRGARAGLAEAQCRMDFNGVRNSGGRIAWSAWDTSSAIAGHAISCEREKADQRVGCRPTPYADTRKRKKLRGIESA